MAATYSTWEYYSGAAHDGKADQTAYVRLAKMAAAEINLRCQGRAEQAPASMTDALQECECALVDILLESEVRQALLPRGIASVSNDGYSVSAMGDMPTDDAAIAAVCRRHLMWPTNLLYAGVARW